jgi:hypothetical protein
VLNANPLTDIKSASMVKYVMKNGRLYDAMTLAQVAPLQTKPDQFWWLDLDPTRGTR